MKVKIFSDTSFVDLENEINDFIKDKKNVTVSMTHIPETEYTESYKSACVLYEEEK